MSDIDVFSHQENYQPLQNLRPDYHEAIKVTLEMAKKHTIADSPIITSFGSGPGNTTMRFTNEFKPASQVTLIDTNKTFLEMAKTRGIKTDKLIIIHGNASETDLEPKSHLAFSVFVYHHLPDEQKDAFIKKMKECLRPDGVLVLTEIFLEGEVQNERYYKKLLDEIPNKAQSEELKKFLEQTAQSQEEEHKVSKTYADEQFTSNGLTLIEEVKVYPQDNTFGQDVGTFVQVYKLA